MHENRLETFEFEYQASTAKNAKGHDEVCYIPKKKTTNSAAATTKKSKSTPKTAESKKRKLETTDEGHPKKPRKTPKTAASAAAVTSTDAATSNSSLSDGGASEEKPRKSLADMLSFDTSSLSAAYDSLPSPTPSEKGRDKNEEVAKKKKKGDIPAGKGITRNVAAAAASSAAVSGSTGQAASTALKGRRQTNVGALKKKEKSDGEDLDGVIGESTPSVRQPSPNHGSVSSNGRTTEREEVDARGRRSSSNLSSPRPLSIDVRESSRDADAEEWDDDVDAASDHESDAGFHEEMGALSPRTENDLFRQFCLCHFAELNLKLPWLNKRQVKAMLEEHWRTLNFDERMWYVYNFLAPRDVGPAVAIPRPTNRILDKLIVADGDGKRRLAALKRKSVTTPPPPPSMSQLKNPQVPPTSPQQQSPRASQPRKCLTASDKTTRDPAIDERKATLSKTLIWEIEKLTANPDNSIKR